MDVVIHHKDEFEEAYPGHGNALPAILIRDSDALPRVLVSAQDLDKIPDTVELMECVEERLIAQYIPTSA